MNAWTIYWILQLDNIGGMVGVASVLAAILLAVLIVYALICQNSNPEEWISSEYKNKAQRALDRAPSVTKAAKKTGFLLAGLLAFSAFLPTTKTAAAMVILPAIVNNERIQHEAGDLYQLAKQALANAVAPDKPEPKK